MIGSTGSGKSEAELVELLRIGRRRDTAIVLLDPHGPLARKAVGHWIGRGDEPRIIYEPLHDTERVLAWPMIPPVRGLTVEARRLERAETRDDLAQCLMAPRGYGSLADRPLTREWLEAALALLLAQREPAMLLRLPEAFRIGSPGYRRLLAGCDDRPVVDRFRDLELIRRRQPVQYEITVGPARRLIEQVRASAVVSLRASGGTFDWQTALTSRSLVAFDGGGVRSRELRRTFFLLVSMNVLHAVRSHFACTGERLPVVLVLEEAGALGLVTPFVLYALQELRKAGLAIHILTQSTRDFGDPAVLEAVLANTPVQTWHQCLSPADQALAARALANATFDPLAIHYTRSRPVRSGVSPMTTTSHGESFDHHGRPLQHDHRTGQSLVPQFVDHEEAYYKSPTLQEQEYRTRLATLRVGERIVQTRERVWCERVRMLREPRCREDQLKAVITRIRSRPIYRAVTPDTTLMKESQLDAAQRLRAMTESPSKSDQEVTP